MNQKIFSVATLLLAGMMLVSCGGRSATPKDLTADNNVVIYLMDYGNDPKVLDMEAYTLGNDNFRTTLWTGRHLQLTVMSIPVGGNIGLERHLGTDQFLRIEEGEGRLEMGDDENNLDFVQHVKANSAILVPAGKWHNITNTGDKPIKLYSLYASVEHPHGTVHKTQIDALEDEHHHVDV